MWEDRLCGMEPDCHYQAQRPHKVGRTQGYALDLVRAQTTGRAEAGQGVCGIIRWSCAIRGHLQGWAGWAGWAPHIKGTGRARPLSSLLRGTCVKLSTCTCEVVSAQRDLFSFTARLPEEVQRDPEEVRGATAPFDTPYSILCISFHLFYC